MLSLGHFFAQQFPWIDIDWEEYEDLERVKSLIRSLGWIARSNVGGELYETRTFSLCIS